MTLISETDEGVDLSEPIKEDTDDLLSTDDVLDDSQDVEVEPDNSEEVEGNDFIQIVDIEW